MTKVHKSVLYNFFSQTYMLSKLQLTLCVPLDRGVPNAGQIKLSAECNIYSLHEESLLIANQCDVLNQRYAINSRYALNSMQDAPRNQLLQYTIE